MRKPVVRKMLEAFIKKMEKNNMRKPVVKKMLEEFGPIETFNKARETAKGYVYGLRAQGKISFSNPVEGENPSIHIVRRTRPEVWEDTFMALVGIGREIHTHYDLGFGKKEFESFPSLDATVMMHIEEPFSEPLFHMHFLTGQFGDYRAEMEGIKDHWVLDPGVIVDMLKKGKFKEIKGHTGWLYSYSQRIRNYPYIDIEGNPQVINQLQSVINNFVADPLSRSAQVITWDPRWDHNDGQMKYKDEDGNEQKAIFDDYHAPCLQRIHFRLFPFEGGYKLNPNTHWRSRCHPKAAPHNIDGMLEGLLELQRKDLENALKKPVVMGRYIDISDSLHVYGHYLDPRMQGLDAEAYLEDIFRIASGEPIEKRLILPGTPIHEMTLETIELEYKARKSDPDHGRNL